MAFSVTFTYVRVSVCMRVGGHLWESILLPSSGIWGLNSAVRHSSECLQPLGHLAGPVPSFQHLLSGDGLLLNTPREEVKDRPKRELRCSQKQGRKGLESP